MRNLTVFHLHTVLMKNSNIPDQLAPPEISWLEALLFSKKDI